MPPVAMKVPSNAQPELLVSSTHSTIFAHDFRRPSPISGISTATSGAGSGRPLPGVAALLTNLRLRDRRPGAQTEARGAIASHKPGTLHPDGHGSSVRPPPGASRELACRDRSRDGR